MKKIILSLFTIIALSACSDDFLDNPNLNNLDSHLFWKTEQDLTEGLNAAYRPLRFNGSYSRWLHILYISRSDEGYSTSPNADFQSYSNFRTRNNGGTEAVMYTWLDGYKGIFWANQVMDAAPRIDMDIEKRQRMAAEAQFLRGVHYFNIGGVYGRGAITLTAIAGEERKIVEQDGLYKQARVDFMEAAKHLPTFYTDRENDLGRVTKGAALGMLAKVLAQEKDWVRVDSVCQEIFKLRGAGGEPLYSLVPNYQDNFTVKNENNSESLFEVQFKNEKVGNIELGCDRPKFLGLPVSGAAWDDATASNIIKTDLEIEKTVDGKVDPRLKHTLFYYDPASTGDLFYGRTWSSWGLNNSKVYWKKYTNYDTQTLETHGLSGINFRLVRLADIYLLYAEALNELGRTNESYEYINKVRHRANLSDLENSTVFTGIGNNQAKMREQIMHERVCELSGETWRWFDLERWGLLTSQEGIAYLKTRDSEFDNFRLGVNHRFPIPYREIPLVKGLEQNPGY